MWGISWVQRKFSLAEGFSPYLLAVPKELIKAAEGNLWANHYREYIKPNSIAYTLISPLPWLIPIGTYSGYTSKHCGIVSVVDHMGQRLNILVMRWESDICTSRWSTSISRHPLRGRSNTLYTLTLRPPFRQRLYRTHRATKWYRTLGLNVSCKSNRFPSLDLGPYVGKWITVFS